MKMSTWIYYFCGYIGITVQARYLGDNIGAKRVGELGNILLLSCVYHKFGHLENTLIGGMAKVLVDELSIEYADHSYDVWVNKAVWTCRVCLFLLDNLKVDVVNIFLSIFAKELWP